MKETVSLVRKVYERFQQKDLPGILATLSEDVTWIVHGPQGIPYAGVRAGKTEVASWFELFGASVEMRRFEPHVLTGSQRHVIVTGRAEGLARATGRPFGTHWCHLWTIHDGEVVQFEDYFDTASVRDAFTN